MPIASQTAELNFPSGVTAAEVGGRTAQTAKTMAEIPGVYANTRQTNTQTEAIRQQEGLDLNDPKYSTKLSAYQASSLDSDGKVNYDQFLKLGTADNSLPWPVKQQLINKYTPLAKRYQIDQIKRNGLDDIPGTLKQLTLVDPEEAKNFAAGIGAYTDYMDNFRSTLATIGRVGEKDPIHGKILLKSFYDGKLSPETSVPAMTYQPVMAPNNDPTLKVPVGTLMPVMDTDATTGMMTPQTQQIPVTDKNGVQQQRPVWDLPDDSKQLSDYFNGLIQFGKTTSAAKQSAFAEQQEYWNDPDRIAEMQSTLDDLKKQPSNLSDEEIAAFEKQLKTNPKKAFDDIPKAVQKAKEWTEAQWDKFDTKVNALNASSRKSIGQSGNANIRAERAWDMLSAPDIVKDPLALSLAITDIMGIMKGGAPDEVQLKEGYKNIETYLANSKQKLTSTPTEVNAPGVVAQLKNMIKGLIDIDNKVIMKNLGIEQVTFKKILYDREGKLTDRAKEYITALSGSLTPAKETTTIRDAMKSIHPSKAKPDSIFVSPKGNKYNF